MNATPEPELSRDRLWLQPVAVGEGVIAVVVYVLFLGAAVIPVLAVQAVLPHAVRLRIGMVVCILGVAWAYILLQVV